MRLLRNLTIGHLDTVRTIDPDRIAVIIEGRTIEFTRFVDRHFVVRIVESIDGRRWNSAYEIDDSAILVWNSLLGIARGHCCDTSEDQLTADAAWVKAVF